MALIPWPRINDVTTTPDQPPRFKHSKIPDYPKSFAELQRSGYPDLQPLQTKRSQGDAFRIVLQEAKLMSGWEIEKSDESKNWIEAVAVTSLLRFKDDIVIEIREGRDGSEIHMRSRSRVGRSDFGANAKRIREFFSRLQRVL